MDNMKVSVAIAASLLTLLAIAYYTGNFSTILSITIPLLTIGFLFGQGQRRAPGKQIAVMTLIVFVAVFCSVLVPDTSIYRILFVGAYFLVGMAYIVFRGLRHQSLVLMNLAGFSLMINIERLRSLTYWKELLSSPSAILILVLLSILGLLMSRYLRPVRTQHA